MRPEGLTLLLLVMLSCSRPIHTQTNLGSDVTISIDAPHAFVKYPDAARLQVTIRNSGTRPYSFTWPPNFRLHPGCASRSVQTDPVEVWFSGTLDREYRPRPYTWRWVPKQPAPAQLVIAPQETRVIANVTFRPPPGHRTLNGGFCVRIYGYDLAGGSHYRGLR